MPNKKLPGTEQTVLNVIAWVRSQVYRHASNLKIGSEENITLHRKLDCDRFESVRLSIPDDIAQLATVPR